MRVIVGCRPALCFERPREVIRAEAGMAFTRAEEALANGAWVAGYVSYEGRAVLGVYEAAKTIELPAARALHSPLLPLLARSDYDRAIADLQRAIYEGDVYQVNFTVPFAFESAAAPLELYARYARASGTSYSAYVEDGSCAVLSWSPELFLDFDGARVRTKPMKGTAALHRIDELHGAKNRAEHVMIVDLVLNDLRRVCSDVEVEAFLTVERYPTFAALTSTLAGRLRDGTTLAQVFDAAFPCGSVTGAPKRAAMRGIARLERMRRGAYCGAIGFLSPERRGWWNVAIRTAQLDRATGIGRFDAGGGIVADSRAADEWNEIAIKSRFLEPSHFAILETLSSAADPAVVRAHAQRLDAAARAFGIAVDAAKALEVALGSVSGGPHLVRLSVMRGGETRVCSEPLEPMAQPVRVCLSAQRSRRDDPFLAYKTSWRPRRDAAAVEARLRGCFDALLRNEDGELTEGARTNLFVEVDGTLWTPPLAAGLLPGILRAHLIAEGRARERGLRLEDLAEADGIYVGNSARGLLRAQIVT